MDCDKCFYCEGLKADGDPIIYKMINYTGIAGGIGPTGSISSKNKSIAIPRSKKAQHIHTLALFIKVLFFIFLFPIAIYSSSYFKASYQLIIFSLLFLALGGAVVHIIYHFTGVKSKLFHSSKYPAVKVLNEKGYSRGSYAMIDATPLGTLLYLGRWIF
jgi:fatty acid desaturase